ncbi:nucleoside hydrolase [Microbacterium sp.]|uniref:nucleoside hydrolase n=1 Tax=Microbacterium sp. TaxID=51671 RepID=UPI003A913C7F
MTYGVILDVDTGIDDAMAIMFAVRHPEIDVRAITCVTGNVGLKQVLANTLSILDVADAPQIPVAAGAQRPLVAAARDASWVHGKDGLGGIGLPASARELSPLHAVELMHRELLAADEPLTIVALAPLTNVALLLRMYPDAAQRIARIVFMGGSASVGNATAVAEFNIWHDPEAAAIVIDSGIPLTMYGLDVFNRVAAEADTIARLADATAPVARTLGGLLGFELTDPGDGTVFTHPLIGDAGAVCALVAPELFTFESRPVQVELAPGFSRGQTMVDRRAYGGEDLVHEPGWTPWPLADVALDVDVPGTLELFFGTLVDTAGAAAS